MKNISLTQVTAFVAVVSLASFLVSAQEAIAHSSEDHSIEHSGSSVNAEAVENTESVEETSEIFTFTSLDTDKDGKLSEKEVIAGKNEWLVKSFKQIDTNGDAALTEQELVDFVSKTASASFQ